MKCKIKIAFTSDIIAPSPNDEVDVPPDYVRDWVRAGYAEALEPFPSETAAAVETAAIPGAPEAAVGKRRRKAAAE